jgi:hypothetical protein
LILLDATHTLAGTTTLLVSLRLAGIPGGWNRAGRRCEPYVDRVAGASGSLIAATQSFLAGAILTMLARTGMPEAYEEGAP